MPLTSSDDIRKVLQEARTIAVFGYSNRPDRPSHNIARYLQAVGYEVYLVNPTIQSTPDERLYASLTDIPVQVDIVDVFRRPEAVPEAVEQAIAAHTKVVWMQLGIVNEQAAAQAEQAGLQVVMDRCSKVEHARLIRATR